jgi:hypothetical protein
MNILLGHRIEIQWTATCKKNRRNMSCSPSQDYLSSCDKNSVSRDNGRYQDTMARSRKLSVVQSHLLLNGQLSLLKYIFNFQPLILRPYDICATWLSLTSTFRKLSGRILYNIFDLFFQQCITIGRLRKFMFIQHIEYHLYLIEVAE